MINIIFSSYTAVACAPIYAFLEFFKPVLCTMFFPSHWLVSHKTIFETMESGERSMNPVAITITSSRKEYWLSWGSNHDLLFESPAHYRHKYWAWRFFADMINHKRINFVKMTINNPQKNIRQARDSNRQLPGLKFCGLLTALTALTSQ